MTGSSLLPVTIYKNKLYFLFGKENEKEDSTKGFSDFGGGQEKGETLLETALREGAEEMTGFLGDAKQLKKYILSHGGVYHLPTNIDYHIHLFFIPYDEKLPFYYNQNHCFLWNHMDKNLLNKTKLFEKIEIQWFTLDDMKKRKNEFRSFYQTLVDLLISKQSQIKTFLSIRKTQNKKKKRKNIKQKQKTKRKI